MGWLVFALICLGGVCVVVLIYLVVRWDEEDRSEVTHHVRPDERWKNDSRV
jgi:hypothetical protein